jgi:hypothetical protein
MAYPRLYSVYAIEAPNIVRHASIYLHVCVRFCARPNTLFALPNANEPGYSVATRFFLAAPAKPGTLYRARLPAARPSPAVERVSAFGDDRCRFERNGSNQ